MRWKHSIESEEYRVGHGAGALNRRCMCDVDENGVYWRQVDRKRRSNAKCKIRRQFMLIPH